MLTKYFARLDLMHSCTQALCWTCSLGRIRVCMVTCKTAGPGRVSNLDYSTDVPPPAQSSTFSPLSMRPSADICIVYNTNNTHSSHRSQVFSGQRRQIQRSNAPSVQLANVGQIRHHGGRQLRVWGKNDTEKVKEAGPTSDWKGDRCCLMVVLAVYASLQTIR